MLPFHQVPRLKLLAVVLAAALVAAALWRFVPGGDAPGNPPRNGDAEAVRADPKLRIASGTDIVQRIFYVKCGDEEVYRTKPADTLIGLNLAQVQKVYSGWTIERFDTQETEMTLKVDSFCREHANHLFVGIKDGYVAVFSGRPGPKAIVREVTSIPVARLMPEDQNELRRGLVVQGREELLRTLEGLQSR